MRETEMKKFIAAAAACILLVLAVPASGGTPPKKSADTGVLATVNGEPITQKEFVAMFTDRHSGHAKFLGGPVEARRFLDIVIDDRLLVQEAYELGLDEDPAVKEAVNSFERGKTVKYLVDREISKKSVPSSADIEAAWNENYGFVLQVRQIAVPSRAAAEEIRSSLLGGGDFESLARSCSISDSARNGGHFMTSWGKQEPGWEKIVFALQPGELSPIIETRDGFEVVIVDYRYDVQKPPLEKQKEEILSTLSRRMLEQRKKDYSAELWARYHVKLEPIDFSPAALLRLRRTAPDTVIARWDNDGSLALKDAFDEQELRDLAGALPQRARYEVDLRIRATVNEPLVALQAAAEKLGEVPEIADLVDQYRNAVMQGALYKEHIYRGLTVTEDEARTYHQSHLDAFWEPEQRHAAQILVSSEADAKLAKADLAGGMAFEEAVKKYSRDYTSIQSGGDLGWITEEKVPAEFKSILTLKEGSVSEPIAFQNTWRIIKILEVKPKRQKTFDEAREAVVQQLSEDKKKSAKKFWVDKLRANAKVEYNDQEIARFVQNNQFDANAPAPQHSIPAGEIPKGE